MKKLYIVYVTLILLLIHIVNAENKVIGIVMDDKDNLISSAKLEFVCDKKNDNLPNSTNHFGAFQINNLSGNCRIFANFDDKIGYVDINPNEGMNKVDIFLNKKSISSNQSRYYVYFLSFLTLSFVLFLLFVIYKRINSKPNQIIMTKRMQDLMMTLNDNEKLIVEFLINENGSATQSKIRHNTGITKTSLFRYILSLENKKFIVTQEFGNMKKVVLSYFFLR